MSIAMVTLTLVACGILGLIFSFKPTWGLVTLIFTIPLERIGAFSLNLVSGYPQLHIAQVVGGALIGAYVLRLIFRAERPRRVIPFYLLLAFFGASLISALLVQVEQVWSIFAWLTFICALFFVTAQLVKRENLPTIKRALLVSAALVCLFGIYQYIGDIAGLPHSLTGIRKEYSKAVLGFPRLQSTALEPLYFANYLMLPLLVGISLQIIGLLKRRADLFILGLIGLAFILTQSRGGYFSAVGGLAALAFLLRGRLKTWLAAYYKKLLLVMVGLFFVSVATVAVSSLQTNKDLSSGPRYLLGFFSTQLTKTGSYSERVRDQKLAISIFQKSPWFGAGVGGFGSSFYGCKTGKCVYRPNNQALEVLAEGGIVGFVTFHSFILSLLYFGYQTVRRSKDLQLALAAGLTAAVIAMTIQSQSFSGFLCCLTHTWVTLALLAGVSSLQPVTKAKAAS